MRIADEADGEVFPGLPNCLAFDILSRIPSAKQLSGVKCVSKAWLYLISDPYFMALHNSRSNQNPPSYCVVPMHFDQDRPRDRSVEFDITLHIQTSDHDGQPITQFDKLIRAHERPYLSLLPSKKQLICMSTSYCIYICNPGTQDFIELPKGSCDPFCLYNVGFGYLPDSMEYKVVRLFYTYRTEHYSDENRLGCEVMTITSDTNNYEWRVMDEACPCAVDEQGSITVNGFVLWRYEDAYWITEEDDCILSFDLEKEKFGVVPPPPCEKTMGFAIVEIKGDLYFADYGESESIMNVWIMKDWKTFEWSKKYNIDFENTAGWWSRRPLDIVELNGEEVILVYWRGDLYYYYVKNKKIMHLEVGEDSIQFCYYHDSFFPLRTAIASGGSS